MRNKSFTSKDGLKKIALTVTTKQCHAHQGVKLLPDWPGNSPDLNPIENLWSQMKNKQQDKRETSKDGLKKIALDRLEEGHPSVCPESV